jgi:hypothetical protein
VTVLTEVGAPVFTHLAALSDELGLFEHARHSSPRIEHGYCVDDVARGLLTTVREPDPDPLVAGLAETYLRFVVEALTPDGLCRNRRSVGGAWTDTPSLGDWWGRAVWALGTAAVRAPLPLSRARAFKGFVSATAQRSPHLRAMSFAAIGAGEVLLARPRDLSARLLLEDFLELFPVRRGAAWPWPEDRLRYGNGSVAEALILAGAALQDEEATATGLELLEFLLHAETSAGHLSVTGMAGSGPQDPRPQYDQQPIEVAALADACARAYDVTGDAAWLTGVDLAWGWFEGDNDNGTVMVDQGTGAGFDGLTPEGRNENRGAESTIAALTTQQHARRLAGIRRTA